jgi:hypothetical protein
VKKEDFNLQAMCDAHRRGDVEAVRKLLDANPELEKTGPHKHTTWLHLAAREGQIGVVGFWLERGWDVNLNSPGLSEAEGFCTALHLAKDASMTGYLLSRGASVNACHREFGTPLHNAIIRAVEPHPNLEQIHALLKAGTDLTLMGGEEKGYTPLAWTRHLKRKSAEQVLREAGAPEKGRRLFGRRHKKMMLDLRRDFTEIYAHLVELVRVFNPSGGNVLGDGGPLKMVEVGFEYSQTGWVVIVFDTRPNAEPDGEWTALIEDNKLERPNWLQAGEAIIDGPITVIRLDGSKAKLSAGTELAQIFGEVLKAVVLKARANGVFMRLPKAPGCELGVEHFSGAYAWPLYEERGQHNLAETEEKRK